MRHRIPRPSPALAVASLALLVALTGTSVAAVSQLVPRNSVGTPQLKNDAVVSTKVKNKSLLAIDFKAGQIPVGPTGPAGPAGPTGTTGPTGPAGQQGPGARWALVRPDGGIAAQSGGITLAAHSTGRYYLNFGSAITGKLVTVSPGFANDSNFRGVILAGPCGGPPEGIFCVTSDNSSTALIVTTDDDNLTVQDHSFYLTVIG